MPGDPYRRPDGTRGDCVDVLPNPSCAEALGIAADGSRFGYMSLDGARTGCSPASSWWSSTVADPRHGSPPM